jgi:nucleolar GTP-binding protein
MGKRRGKVAPEYEEFVFGRQRKEGFAWGDIRPILRAQKLQDKVFHRASLITIEDRESFYRRKKTAMARVESVGDTSKDTLLAFVGAFPDFGRLHPFYRELAETLIDVGRARQDLRRLQRAAELISDVCRKNLRQMQKGARADFVEGKRREVYGRVGSIMKELDPALQRLERARLAMKQVPTLDLDLPTVVVAGFPNVGKSAFVSRVCTAKPKVAPYPFTTQGIIVGHALLGGREVQVVDTPGLLDRPASERNEIEQRALAAIGNLGDVVLFLFDPTEGAVASMEEQEHLLAEVRDLFKKRLIIEVENKSDARVTKSPRMRMSALKGEGVEEVWDHVRAVLPGRGAAPAWAEDEE